MLQFFALDLWGGHFQSENFCCKLFLRLNEFPEKIATYFPEKGGGGSKVVRKFFGNSSISEKTAFPKAFDVNFSQGWRGGERMS